jgi:outer membrane protein, heavy metal efflux system
VTARNTWLVSVSTALLGSACGLAPVDAPHDVALDRDAAWTTLERMADEPALAAAGGLTVDELVAIALRNNFDLRAKRSERGLAEAQLFAAGLLPDPEVDVRALASGAAEASVVLDLLQALRTKPRREDVARVAIEQVDLEIAALEWETVTAVERAFIDSHEARAQVRLLEQQRAAAEVEATAARRAAELGEIGALAVLDTESLVLDLDAELAAMRGAAFAAESELERLLGLPVAVELTLGDLSPDSPLPSRDEWVGRLRESRLDLRIAELEQRRARADLALARGEAWGLPALGPAVESDPEGETDFGLEVGFTLPLFSGNRAAIADAAARATVAVENYVATLHRAANELDAALAGARFAVTESKIWRDEILPRSRSALEIVRVGVANGQLTTVEGSRRMRESLARERRALEADFEYRRALLEVERIVGPRAP